MIDLQIKTHHKRQVIDITEHINQNLGAVKNGLCNIFVLHTTTAVSCVDMDPGADLDFLDALEAIVPKLGYRHPHDPSHFPDHVLSALVGVSLNIPVKNGQLMLGTWQRVVLMEFDGPRERNIIISISKSDE